MLPETSLVKRKSRDVEPVHLLVSGAQMVDLGLDAVGHEEMLVRGTDAIVSHRDIFNDPVAAETADAEPDLLFLPA